LNVDTPHPIGLNAIQLASPPILELHPQPVTNWFSGFNARDFRAIDHIDDLESFVTENDSHRGLLSPHFGTRPERWWKL